MDGAKVEFITTDTKHPRVTINRERITCKASEWTQELIGSLGVLAVREYDKYMAEGRTKTIRGRYLDGQIRWND